MDQDYECRLLRQINIQNENASPIVSKYKGFLSILSDSLYVMFLLWTKANFAV